MSIAITILVTFVVGTAYASIFEWVLHKYVMHRPIWKFRYPFETHALTHHRLFRADHSYHLQTWAGREKIGMAWWNGPTLIALATTPFILVAMCLRNFIDPHEVGAILVASFCVIAGYYAAYEYLHWCMHLPRSRWVERLHIFRRLNGHHILHHRYIGTNFNVVLPFADFLFGTLLLRARASFPQVHGPSVPDIQPSSM